jgi:hypothetical protein
MSLELDPYSPTPFPTVESTALAIGRSLSRLRWHLVQWLLLCPRRLKETQLKIVKPAEHRQKLQLALASIYARSEGLGAGMEPVRAAAARAQAEPTQGAYQARLEDALWQAASRAWNFPGDEYESAVHCERRLIVRDFGEPLIDPIAAPIVDCSADASSWLALGTLIDGGVCRPDIADHLDAGSGAELRVDAYSAWRAHEQYKVLKSIRGDEEELADALSKQSTPEDPIEESLAEILGTASRAPGDLRPQRFWAADVTTAWRALELEGGLLDEIEGAVAEPFVEKLFRSALAAAGAGDSRLWVDLAQNLVHFDGRPIPVSEQQAFIFYVLRSHVGKENSISFPKIKKLGGSKLFGENDKAIDYTPTLPAALKPLVHTSTRRGLWLEFDAKAH